MVNLEYVNSCKGYSTLVVDDTDLMGTEDQDLVVSVTENPKDIGVNISKATLPSPLAFDDDDTIIDSSDEIVEDIFVKHDNVKKDDSEDPESNPHYKRLIKNVRDEGMEGFDEIHLKDTI